MKRVILISTLMVLGFSLFAQNTIDNILTEIEKNNTTLAAYRKGTDAEKIGNKTGLTPQNPEVEFNYLWGNPSSIGNRTDFSIKQSFDFPSAYAYKNQISNLKNEQAKLEYQKQRNELLFQARMICIKLVFLNSLKLELTKRQAEALKISEAYNAQYNSGEVGILEYNKAQINLLNVEKEAENNEIERRTLFDELTTLNGGISISLNDHIYVTQKIPENFEQWFAQKKADSPILQWVKQEITISEKQTRLNSALSLPKFYGGFMSEKVVGQQFQGVSLGVSIPLWESKNTVRYANAKTIALQSIEADTKLQFYNRMKGSHNKVIALQNNATDYRKKFKMFNNSELLEKAFNIGEISLTEYLYERSWYHESYYKLLEMEMNLNIAFAELNKYQ